MKPYRAITESCKPFETSPDICAIHREWMEVCIDAQKARIKELEERMRIRAVLSFPRRVDFLWVDPAKGDHFTAHKDGTPYIYKMSESEPAGYFPVVIVPEDLVGEVVIIRKVRRDGKE